jgi:enamine deaminase RidA (YjgF/YER057c/UK114 family)
MLAWSCRVGWLAANLLIRGHDSVLGTHRPFARDGAYLGIGDVPAHAAQVFENLTAVVEPEGATVEDVVSPTTYFAAVENAAAVGSVRKTYFTGELVLDGGRPR